MIDPEFVDSHAHLDREVFDDDRASVLERARQAGVKTILNIALGPDEDVIERAHRFTLEHRGIYLAVGIHPHDVGRMTNNTVSLLRNYCSKERFVAVGEIGLDYHHGPASKETQRARFRELLELALDANFPVVVHSREAFDDTLQDLADLNVLENVGGVLHCFGGGAEEAKRALELGAYIGFAGILTFKKAENVKKAARVVPLDRILLETDAPFLAPEPHRGKRNEPAFVVRIAEALAQIKGVTVQEVARVTTQNAGKLFRLPTATA